MYKVHQFEKSAAQYAKEKKWGNGIISRKNFEIKLSEVRRNKRIRKWREQKGQCYYCRKHLSQSETTYDHIIPQSEGGSEHYDNFVVACKKCNGTRGSLSFELFCNLVTCEEDREGFVNAARNIKSRKIEEKRKDAEIKNRVAAQIMSNFGPISKKYKKSKKLIGLTTSSLHGIKNNKKVSKKDKDRKMKIYNDRLALLNKIKNKWVTKRDENNHLLKIEAKKKKSL